MPASTRRHRTLAAPAVAALAAGMLLLSACGGSSGGKPSASKTDAAPPTSSSPSPTKVPATQAELDTLMLKPTDFPAGWKASQHEADPNEAQYRAEVVACLGIRNSETDKLAEVNSEDFDLGDVSVSSSASSYRTQDAVDADTAALSNAKFGPCYEQQLRKQVASAIPAGATIESVSFTVTPGSSGGPANVVATASGSVKIAVSGRQTVLNVLVAYIAGPLLKAEVDVQNVDKAVPQDVFTTAVTTVAKRVAAL